MSFVSDGDKKTFMLHYPTCYKHPVLLRMGFTLESVESLVRLIQVCKDKMSLFDSMGQSERYST